MISSHAFTKYILLLESRSAAKNNKDATKLRCIFGKPITDVVL